MLTLAFTSGSKALNTSTSTAPSLRATWRSRSLMKLSADSGSESAEVSRAAAAGSARASPAGLAGQFADPRYRVRIPMTSLSVCLTSL